MTAPSAEFATATLRRLMAAVEIPSFRALSRAAEVSPWTIAQLRQGRIAALRVSALQAIAAALGLSVAEVLAQFLPEAASPVAESRDRVAALQHEYQRLQAQLDTVAQDARQTVEQSILTQLEPWMLQWPTARHAVSQNPDLPASRLIPLVAPVEHLLTMWGVEAIASVGDEVPYDPHCHQLMGGSAEPGQLVRVRYVGYRQGDRLLHRAKVSPL